MSTINITKEEIYALTDLVEQAYTDASFNEPGESESEQLKLVSSLLGRLEDQLKK